MRWPNNSNGCSAINDYTQSSYAYVCQGTWLINQYMCFIVCQINYLNTWIDFLSTLGAAPLLQSLQLKAGTTLNISLKLLCSCPTIITGGSVRQARNHWGHKEQLCVCVQALWLDQWISLHTHNVYQINYLNTWRNFPSAHSAATLLQSLQLKAGTTLKIWVKLWCDGFNKTNDLPQ